MRDPQPSVLAILVVRDAAPWLGRVLASLARQTHPRLGVLAVDNASTDGSAELLEARLGSGRVLRMKQNVGFAGAVHRAMSVPAVRAADYVLLLHDDTALAPDAVAHLVSTATRLEGAGAVAPKVLDWQHPSVLLDIGQATDRFGYPYSPLEEGEIDHGQYDAVREVLFVSSAAMLVSREVWSRAGLPDERLRHDADLDFCWRIRLAGLRVLVEPRAVAVHRLAGARGERRDDGDPAERYLTERGGLLSLLKNYRLLTLLWVLPIYAVQAVIRALFYLLTRHFDRALQLARAWMWNLVHLPGTLRRRFRAQRGRRVPDREISRLMAPAGTRLQRWFAQASWLLASRHEPAADAEDEPGAAPAGRQAATFAARHPAAVASALAAVVTLVAFRDVLFVPRIEGGLVPALPGGPGAFFRELASPWRSTGFGGEGISSPALVPLGIGSFVTLGSPTLLVRLLVALTPFLAGWSCYRAVVRLTRDAGAAAVAAACYALSALVLWTASEGSLPAIVLVLAVPWLSVRFLSEFDGRSPVTPLRWLVGTSMGLALAGVFFPPVWLSVALMIAPALLVTERGGNRIRGVVLSLAALAGAAVLVFPFAAELAVAGSVVPSGILGQSDFQALLRLSPGAAPGSWGAALFLPMAAVLSFPFVAERRRWAGRALLSAGAGILLAWLSAAGYVPGPFGSPLAFLAPAAFSMAAIVGLSIPALVPSVRRAAFGFAQLLVVVLTVVLGAGLFLQATGAVAGGWSVGGNALPPAWPVVAAAEPGQTFRVLWLGDPADGAFPAPGGPAQGTVGMDRGSVAYGVTGRGGRSVLAIGLPASGPAHETLEDAVGTVLSGRVRHGGAILASFGIRYVVAGQGDLPPEAAMRLSDQLDLDLIQQAGGLRIYRNARALPVASHIRGERAVRLARAEDPLAAAAVDRARVQPLQPVGSPTWRGSVGEDGSGLVTLATEFHPDWALEASPGETSGPFQAFGWAVGFESPPEATDVTVSFDGGLRRVGELLGMGSLWLGALWAVRRRPEEADRGDRVRRKSATAPIRRPPRRASLQSAGGRSPR